MFKVGDTVKCIDNSGLVYNEITVGDFYETLEIDDIYIKIVDDTNSKRYFRKDRFEVFKKSTIKLEFTKEKTSDNNGGATGYYDLPVDAKNVQDLIEYKEMNFSQGNIIKAIYRAGSCEHSEYERDLNKIIWFANRELERIRKGK